MTVYFMWGASTLKPGLFQRAVQGTGRNVDGGVAHDRNCPWLAMKVARSALPVTLAHWAGVRETVMAAATYILRGGADAMAVSGMMKLAVTSANANQQVPPSPAMCKRSCADNVDRGPSSNLRVRTHSA
jgi:hypothetical protein